MKRSSTMVLVMVLVQGVAAMVVPQQVQARIVNAQNSLIVALEGNGTTAESVAETTTPSATTTPATDTTTPATDTTTPATDTTTTPVTVTTTTPATVTTTTPATITTTTSTPTTTLLTTTTTTSSPHESPHSLPGWATALIILAALALIFTLLGVLFVRFRRRSIPLAKPVDLLRKSTVAHGPKPMRVDVFGVMYQTKLAKGMISKEFEMVQEYSARLGATKTRNVGQLEKNQNRNRFVDIIPYDDNYITLQKEQGLPPSTYVNASYVEDLEGLGRVIVTQGPKQNTVVDFWRMVVEHRARHIIMLTNTQEQGRVKCVQYWPAHGQRIHFDTLSLHTAEEEEVHPGLLRRKVEVTLEDEEVEEEGREVHSVSQLHLTSWPDHGVPDHVNSLLAFLQVASTFKDDNYLVVHCSAGVGRTGTFLALQHLTELVRSGESSIDILGTVLLLRETRPKMVQTLQQYSFLYQAMDVFIKSWRRGELAPAVVLKDDVLDSGMDNFGFENVQL